MKFAFLSVVDLDGTPMVSILIYQYFTFGDRQIAREVGSIIKPFESSAELVLDLIENEINSVETDNQTIYSILIERKLIPTIFKYQVEGTREAVERDTDMLRELYEINSVQSVSGQSDSELPKWRTWCVAKLEKIIQILKTKGIKTDGN